MRRFVANVDFAGGYTLSPDGRRLMWQQAVGTDTGLAVRPVAGGAVRTFPTGFLSRPAGPTYLWLQDSRHVAFLKDLRGDENTQLHVFDSQGDFEPWAVTPWPGARSYFVGHEPAGPCPTKYERAPGQGVTAHGSKSPWLSNTCSCVFSSPREVLQERHVPAVLQPR